MHVCSHNRLAGISNAEYVATKDFYINHHHIIDIISYTVPMIQVVITMLNKNTWGVKKCGATAGVTKRFDIS